MLRRMQTRSRAAHCTLALCCHSDLASSQTMPSSVLETIDSCEDETLSPTVECLGEGVFYFPGSVHLDPLGYHWPLHHRRQKPPSSSPGTTSRGPLVRMWSQATPRAGEEVNGLIISPVFCGDGGHLLQWRTVHIYREKTHRKTPDARDAITEPRSFLLPFHLSTDKSLRTHHIQLHPTAAHSLWRKIGYIPSCDKSVSCRPHQEIQLRTPFGDINGFVASALPLRSSPHAEVPRSNLALHSLCTTHVRHQSMWTRRTILRRSCPLHISAHHNVISGDLSHVLIAADKYAALVAREELTFISACMALTYDTANQYLSRNLQQHPLHVQQEMTAAVHAHKWLQLNPRSHPSITATPRTHSTS